MVSPHSLHFRSCTLLAFVATVVTSTAGKITSKMLTSMINAVSSMINAVSSLTLTSLRGRLRLWPMGFPLWESPEIEMSRNSYAQAHDDGQLRRHKLSNNSGIDAVHMRYPLATSVSAFKGLSFMLCTSCYCSMHGHDGVIGCYHDRSWLQTRTAWHCWNSGLWIHHLRYWKFIRRE